jgi:hypothetical protein
MSSSQEPIDYYDYGNHEQYMYQFAYACKESQCPQYHENDNNRPKYIHSWLPEINRHDPYIKLRRMMLTRHRWENSARVMAEPEGFADAEV